MAIKAFRIGFSFSMPSKLPVTSPSGDIFSAESAH
jgi:hypothetical protein